MKLLKKLFDKNPLLFTIMWIVTYIILFSVGDALSTLVGIEKIFTLFIGLILSSILFIFINKYKLTNNFGLNKSKTNSKRMLFYIPCIVLLSANLWFGVKLNYSIIETVIYILTMFCVGFLEELIFRGFLFNTLKKDNLKIAILVSSLTFGIGHIVNLFNGSQIDLLSNILQVIYATSAGFMFVMIYQKTDSLIICILTHAIFNGLSAFCVEPSVIEYKILSSIIITLITGFYALYLYKIINKTKE